MNDSHQFNVMLDGTPFPEEIIRRIWEKAIRIPNTTLTLPPGIRIDACGAMIRFEDFGRRDREHGWEIDHIMPRSAGGTDELSNLQPLHWKNNDFKGDQVNNLRCLFPVPGLLMIIRWHPCGMKGCETIASRTDDC